MPEVYCLILKDSIPAEIKFSKEEIEETKKEYLAFGSFKEKDLKIKELWSEDIGDYIYNKLKDIPNIQNKLAYFQSFSPVLALLRIAVDLHNCGSLKQIADDFISGKTTILSSDGGETSFEDIKKFEPDDEIPF